MPRESELEPWRQRLLSGARYIREYGWVQGRLGGCGGPACLIGAMFETSTPETVGHPAIYARERLRNHLGVVSVSDWNDAPGRTAEEVIAAMEFVALDGVSPLSGIQAMLGGRG